MTATPGLSTVAPIVVGSQEVMSAMFDFDMSSAVNQLVNTSGATVTVASTASVVAKVINLPLNAMITSGELDVSVVSNDTGTATLAIGDVNSASRYLSATTLKSLGRTAIVPTGYIGVGEGLQITIANQNANATTGKFRVRVEYVITNRVSEVQPYST